MRTDRGVAFACALSLLMPGLAAAQAAPQSYVRSAVNSTTRPQADVLRDHARKPAEVITFAGLHLDDQIADIMPGQGYYTRIFSKVVGPAGHVYAIVPAELAKATPKYGVAARNLAADPALGNVTALIEPSDAISTPKPLDMAWTSDNYHDLYGFFGAAQAAKFDAAVFRALKPDGIFLVIDHVAPAGTSATSSKTLHRIDPETVKTQVLAAGFKLEAESMLLRNPADTHTLVVFDPAIRGHTDQFIFKFRKPR